MWRLWLAGKIMLTELRHLSIDDIDAANRALDAHERALAESTPPDPPRRGKR